MRSAFATTGTACAVPLVVVDAFTTTVFRGNPAAVVLLTTAQAAAASDATLLACAAEMNLSETVFLSPIDAVTWRGAYGPVPPPPPFSSPVSMKSDKKNHDGIDAHATEAGSSPVDNNLHPCHRRACFNIRWFTPKREVGLCGHATLAAAHALFAPPLLEGNATHSSNKEDDVTTSQQHPFALPPTVEGIAVYNAVSGWLGVSCSRRHGISAIAPQPEGQRSPPRYVLDFPMRPPVALWAAATSTSRPPAAAPTAACNADEATDAVIGVTALVERVCAALNIDRSDAEALQLHKGSCKYLLVLRREGAVRDAVLDVDALKRAFDPNQDPSTIPVAPLSLTITSRSDSTATTSSTSTTGEGEGEAPEVVSRHFAPWVGIDEDPVTGAAHVVLAPYWLRRLAQEERGEGRRAESSDDGRWHDEEGEVPLHRSLRCFQASARGGYLTCTTMLNARLALEGSAVTFLAGTAFIPSA